MKEKLLHFYRGHKAGVLGAVGGFAVGAGMLALGFWKTMFLIFCIIAGFAFGKIYVSDTPMGAKLRQIFRFQEDNE